MITPRENFHRMMTADRPERLPFDMWITPPILDVIEAHTGTRDLDAAFGMDLQSVHVAYRNDSEAWIAAYRELNVPLPGEFTVGFAGITHAVPPLEDLGKAYHLRQMLHPLAVIESVEQLERLPWPDISDPAIYAHIPDQVKAIHAAGKIAVGQMPCTAFEFSWYVRGMDHLFLDLTLGNGIGDWLLDWFTARAVEAVRVYCRAGVDVILLGDDVGTQRGMMMSVPYWRQHMKPRLKAVIDAFSPDGGRKPYAFYHSDGDVRPILDELVEVGVEILNPVQPECMPPGEVIPAHQHHLAFWGLIGTQTTMPFGTPGDVRRAVLECVDFVRKGARIVVAPTHCLEPDVPWENIEAYVKTVKETRI